MTEPVIIKDTADVYCPKYDSLHVDNKDSTTIHALIRTPEMKIPGPFLLSQKPPFVYILPPEIKHITFALRVYGLVSCWPDGISHYMHIYICVSSYVTMCYNTCTLCTDEDPLICLPQAAYLKVFRLLLQLFHSWSGEPPKDLTLTVYLALIVPVYLAGCSL